MSPDLITLLVIGIFVVLMAFETPIAFALAAGGGVGIALLRTTELAGSTFGSVPFSDVASYGLAIIPMYILLGMFALHGRLAERVFSLAAVVLGRFPGGIGVATVAACAGFAAVSGSSVATAATIGKTSVHEMVRTGYRPGFAGGIVAIAGTLGILIPPSIAMVLYGVIARESIAQLLVAGIVPGLIAALAYMAYIVIRARTFISTDEATLALALEEISGPGPRKSPSQGAAADGSEKSAVITKAQKIRAAAWIGAIFLTVLGGIFSGWFTIVESAAIGALIALTMLVLENSRRKEGPGVLQRLKESVLEAASVTSMAFALVIGAGILSTYLVMARVPIQLTEWVVGLEMPSWLIVVMILALLIPLGMFLETLSLLVIVVPLVHPVILELGFNGIWFGVLFVIMLEIGLVTPPVGMNTYIVSMTSGVRPESVFKGVTPFIGVSLAVVALIFVVPDIALWLPGLVVE